MNVKILLISLALSGTLQATNIKIIYDSGKTIDATEFYPFKQPTEKEINQMVKKITLEKSHNKAQQ